MTQTITKLVGLEIYTNLFFGYMSFLFTILPGFHRISPLSTKVTYVGSLTLPSLGLCFSTPKRLTQNHTPARCHDVPFISFVGVSDINQCDPLGRHQVTLSQLSQGNLSFILGLEGKTKHLGKLTYPSKV